MPTSTPRASGESWWHICRFHLAISGCATRSCSTEMFSISETPIIAGPYGVVGVVNCDIAYARLWILLQYLRPSHWR